MGANYAYHADGTHKSRSRLAKEWKISTPPDTAKVKKSESTLFGLHYMPS